MLCDAVELAPRQMLGKIVTDLDGVHAKRVTQRL